VYEVIYVGIVDEYQKGNTSISEVVNLPDNINSKVLISYDSIKIDSDIPLISDSDHQRIFPNSIKNMRRRIKNVGDRDRTFLPLWMRSIQDQAFVETGYLSAIVICYVKPGLSRKIISRIKAKTETATRGDWDPTVLYRVNDSVRFQGNVYAAVKNITGIRPGEVDSADEEPWIKNFNFKSINFTADRYLIDVLDGVIENKYLAFPQRGEKLP
jgi:hypothetical protein